MVKEKTKKHIYEEIAESIASQINSGAYSTGDKVPSVRKLSKSLGVSTKTVEQSYILLESQGLIQAKPQSGYFVTEKLLPEIEFNNKGPVINNYQCDELIAKLYKGARKPGVVHLGPAYPSTSILPLKKLSQITASIARENNPKTISYEFPPGNLDLRQQIAQRSSEWGKFFSPEELIIVHGVTEAMNIALKVIAKPGDYLITESPTSFATLQIIEGFGMKALELPTHPKNGIDLASVRKALNTYENIAGIFLCPTNSNPLCSTMSEENKKELYELFADRDIPILEDDVYGELYFQEERPKPIKAFDEKGIVIYMSSFSKSIAPGYRVGYTYPGRYYEEMTKHKILTSYTTNSLSQMVIAEFLQSGGYDRCLRNLRKQYKEQVDIFSELVSKHFPEGTKVSRPQGSFFLWIELPDKIDSEDFYDKAIEQNISIAPGAMFTTSKNFNNFIRISCSQSISNEIVTAIKKLGDICRSY